MNYLMTEEVHAEILAKLRAALEAVPKITGELLKVSAALREESAASAPLDAVFSALVETVSLPILEATHAMHRAKGDTLKATLERIVAEHRGQSTRN